MKKENILKTKSFQFAVEIIKLSDELHLKKEYIISKQILRSGTAVGALTREAKFAQSMADFINKLSISVKEANETLYWLELLVEVKRISVERYNEMSSFCNEIISISVARSYLKKGSCGNFKYFGEN